MNFSNIKNKLEERAKLVLTFLAAAGFLTGFLFVLLGLGAKPDESIINARAPEVKINFSVFQKDEFKDLEVFEGSSRPEEQGRDAPFSPYMVEEEEELEMEDEEEGEEEGEEPSQPEGFEEEGIF